MIYNNVRVNANLAFTLWAHGCTKYEAGSVGEKESLMKRDGPSLESAKQQEIEAAGEGGLTRRVCFGAKSESK